MVEKPDYRGLVQQVPGIPVAEQIALLELYAPTEIYVCKSAEDFDAFVRQMRPPRVAVVAHAGLLGEQRGNIHARQDNFAAMKVGIHKRGCYFEDATSRQNSKRHWPAMRTAGNDLCRRLAQGRKSALNAKRGVKPWNAKLIPGDKGTIRDKWYVIKGTRTVDDAVADIKATLGKRAPGRTVLYREFGEPVMKKR
jgi:hypothetical protein